MKLELDEIFSVIDKVNSTGLDSFAYRDADIRLSIKKRGGKTEGARQAPVRSPEKTALSGGEAGAEGKAGPEEKTGTGGGAGAGLTISSPMVGTFYAAPAEDQAPFVTEGDTVRKGQVIGIVEAMKLMNEIESEYDGVVEEILVKNEQLVEYGQPLMRLREV